MSADTDPAPAEKPRVLAVLRAPQVGRLLAASLVGRLPQASAPIALRLDLTPSSFTLIQFCFPRRSLRSSEGGSFRFTMSTSTSPSLSKSPKAHPRLQ